MTVGAGLNSDLSTVQISRRLSNLVHNVAVVAVSQSHNFCLISEFRMSDTNLYLSVEISTTETDTDYESDDNTLDDLANSTDETRINVEDEEEDTNHQR